MKKICMVAYTNYVSDARPRREAETLARRGDQVDFIALAETGGPAVEMVEGVRLFRMKQSRYRGSSGIAYGLAYLRFICSVALKLARLHGKKRYDIVYVHTMPDLLVLVGLIPSFFGARIVLNLHDMMPEIYMSKFGISERHPLIRLLTLQEQFSIRRADKVICVHDPHREVLGKRGTDLTRVTVLPNVPDPRIFQHTGPITRRDEPFRIVYHGTIARRLGLDLAVRAFMKAAAVCPDAQFEIFGDGDAAEGLEQQIEASGLHDRIHFRRRTFRVELIAGMIQGASLGLIPNRRDPATEYMLPVKLLEYMHLGIPVVAPRLKTIQHYLSEYQVAYYEAGDVDGLSAAICDLYADPAKREALSRNGTEFSKSFSWNTLKQRLYDVVDGWPDAALTSVSPSRHTGSPAE